jgi:hemerythrin-like domain-containing protein
MSAIRVLVAQHRAIQQLFEALTSGARANAKVRGRKLSQLAEELIAHLAAEDAVFYPAARRAFGATEAEESLRDEHLGLRVQLRRVLETKVGSEPFGERLETLRAMFDRHVESEEAELFPRVEAALGRIEIEALGAEVVASRPCVWVVMKEGQAERRPGDPRVLRSRVSLPIPPSTPD